jgi:formylglycine-generating enzyme required for sulfatase activity
MVLVPAGTFMMGSNEDIFEFPIHQVTISRPFYMSATQVTQKEWVAVMEDNPSKCRGDNLPVDHVYWIDAVHYCNERSTNEGLTPVYSFVRESPEISRDPLAGIAVKYDMNANGYRLPTEAEWDWASKGGGKDAVITKYSGSDNIDEVAWYKGNSGGKTQPVGTKKPNSLGIYDMTGNVYEWCWDPKDNYKSEPQIDPLGGDRWQTHWRINRGGSADWVEIHVASRNWGSGWIGTEKKTRKEFENASLYGLRVCRNVPL